MKFFTKEVKIGITAIVAICLCYYIICFLKGINLFKASNTYYVEFENIQGLTVSNNVMANGYTVGTVRSIDYDYETSKKVTVAIELNKEMRVPVGTRAELETSLMGGVTMNLVLGNNPTQFLPHGATIKGGPHEGPIARVQNALPNVLALIPKLDSILTKMNNLASNGNLDKMLGDAAQTAKNLSSASAKLNMLMDKEVPSVLHNLDAASQHVNQLTQNLSQLDVQQINSTVSEAKGTLANVNRLSNSLNSTAEQFHKQLSSKDNSLGLLLNSRSVYDQLDSTLKNADSLVVDLRQHPKRYVHFSIFGKKSK